MHQAAVFVKFALCLYFIYIAAAIEADSWATSCLFSVDFYRFMVFLLAVPPVSYVFIACDILLSKCTNLVKIKAK